MHRIGQRRPSVFPDRLARRPGLFLESLESRRMLSVAGTDTIITPNLATLAAELGGSQSGTGIVSSVTNQAPVSTALTPAQIATAYGISLSSASGSGETIAIVDAYNDPNIKADLAAFDAKYGLA